MFEKWKQRSNIKENIEYNKQMAKESKRLYYKTHNHKYLDEMFHYESEARHYECELARL